MEIFAEAQRYLQELTRIPDFLAKNALKGTALRQGDYTFIGTR